MPYVINMGLIACRPEELKHDDKAIWPTIGPIHEAVKFVQASTTKGLFTDRMMRAIDMCYPDDAERMKAALETLMGWCPAGEIPHTFTVNCQTAGCQQNAGHSGSCGADGDAGLAGLADGGRYVYNVYASRAHESPVDIIGEARARREASDHAVDALRYMTTSRRTGRTAAMQSVVFGGPVMTVAPAMRTPRLPRTQYLPSTCNCRRSGRHRGTVGPRHVLDCPEFR